MTEHRLCQRGEEWMEGGDVHVSGIEASGVRESVGPRSMMVRREVVVLRGVTVATVRELADPVFHEPVNGEGDVRK